MTKTYSQLVREARASVREVDNAGAQALADAGALVVDVRETTEWQEGHVVGAVHVPRGFLESRIESIAPDRSRPLVVYCAAGVRSAFAAQALAEMGYTDVVSMAPGFQGWKSEGRPWKAPVVLSAEQQKRYSRHLLIPEVGAEGQQKLLNSKVLFIGAGGLGSPGLLYLAAAGVGTLGIVDFDVVELSNLQRQVVHSHARLGQKKTESAAETVSALNPDVTVVQHDEMLTDDNVARLIAGYDLIVDGTDTFETRYSLNDAAVRARIPVVHASVFRFEGQLTVFKPFEGPCYRCLYPSPPPPELAPGCSVAGVLGVVPGVMGLLQATEGVKVLLGIGDPLVGRLLIYDALDGTFQELQLRRDPACPACGEDARPVADSAARVAEVAGA
ncbi:MAG TPA: molybdopterin-synthase adenylyltransferase MoeB [Candidatus Limnocylindria bacterium]|nr:molybdopterin-synthase adenylyltransferase MoeB [Candidatus Limnocylindria bacterium]